MTANEQLLDAVLRHQVYLLRFSGHLRNQIIDLLEKTEQQIDDLIRARVESGRITPTSLKRFQLLQKAVAKIRLRSWNDANSLWMKELERMAMLEADFVAGLMKTVSPVELNFALPSEEQLRFIARSVPLRGKNLKEWAKELTRADMARISDQIKIGMVMGESGPQIARRIVGTAKTKAGSAVNITENAAEAISRTAVSAIANRVRQELFEKNSAFLTKEVFVATLDSRTTPICRSLDGKVYKTGEGPLPPLHMNCRSLRVAFFGEAIGHRPFRAFTDRQLIREFNELEDLNAKSRSDLPKGFKKKYDEFARRRIRELTGRVPSKLTYGEWLIRQPASFQDEVLGKTRGALFRRGKLPLDHFVDSAGKEIPLNELAVKERQAFLDAGLDPEDFI